MSPSEVAARYAAYVWYTNVRDARGPKVGAEALSFAEKNWQIFQPAANAGLGRLLLRVAKKSAARVRRLGQMDALQNLAAAG